MIFCHSPTFSKSTHPSNFGELCKNCTTHVSTTFGRMIGKTQRSITKHNRDCFNRPPPQSRRPGETHMIWAHFPINHCTTEWGRTLGAEGSHPEGRKKTKVLTFLPVGIVGNQLTPILIGKARERFFRHVISMHFVF